MNTKACLKCGEEKGLGEFSPDKRKKDGLYTRCKTCRVEDCRIHREANREKVRKSSREWARRNGDYMKQYADKNRFMVALYKAKSHAKKYGHALCTATVDELKAVFTGKCAICGVPEIECKRKLCVDHCHKTGELRGFLCGKCNKALGLFNDSEEILIDALYYIMRAQVK